MKKQLPRSWGGESLLGLIALMSSVAGLAGCQGMASDTSGPGQAAPRDHVGPAWRLEAEDAVAISNGDGFRSAVKLIEARPIPRREIAQLTMQITQASGDSVRSEMQFKRLSNGLQHVTHDIPAHAGATEQKERFVDAYGVASVLYWNDRIYSQRPMAPNEVRLLSGKLYSSTSAFELESLMSGGGGYVLKCTPGAGVAASSLHPEFTGQAVAFECTSDFGLERIWYLADQARYLPGQNFGDDGELQSTFKVLRVRFSGDGR